MVSAQTWRLFLTVLLGVAVGIVSALVDADLAHADHAPTPTTVSVATYDGHANLSAFAVDYDSAASPSPRRATGAQGQSLAPSEGLSAPRGTPPLFSQTTASSSFQHGPFAGQSVGDVASAIRTGKINPAELPIDVIVRNGETIGLNTRSMLALRRAGIDPSDWLINDVTGIPGTERLLTERLLRNNLNGGIDILRITGAGPNASSLR